MADNIPITSGAGLTVRTDEDGSGFQHQIVKMEFGGDGSFTLVTTAAGLPVQILSLPDLGLNSSVKITSLPDLGLNSSVKITSLPDLGANSSVKITSLPPFPTVVTTGIVSIASNTSILTVSGTTIAITSLPDIGLGSSVKVSSLPPFPTVVVTGIVSVASNTSIMTVSGTTIAITSLPPIPSHAVTNAGTFVVQTTGIVSISSNTSILTVSGTTIAITSLPDIGAGSSIKITSLPDLGQNSFVKISSLPGVVLISATNAIPVNVVAGGAGNGSILDGANNAIKASVLSFSNASPLAVRLTDTNGDYTAAGGGTQYADGAARGTATGTIAMGDDGTSIQALACNTSGHLRVEVMSAPSSSVTVQYVTVSNLATVPLTVSGTTIAITSLPDIGAGSSIKITSLPPFPNSLLQVSGTTIAITSLPDIGANSSIKITSLPPFAAGSSVTVSNLASVPLTVSGTTIAITSLPDIGANSSIKVTSLPPFPTVVVTGIVSVASNTSILTVSGTTIAITSLPAFPAYAGVKVESMPSLAFGNSVTVTGISVSGVNILSLPSLAFGNAVSATATGVFRITSLPDLGANSSIKITSLPALGAGSAVLISENAYRAAVGTTPPLSGYFRMTATFPSAQTLARLVQRPASTTALHITSCIFSNAQTHGNFSLIESGVSSRIILERIYFGAYGGAVLNFPMPLVLLTNSCLLFTSRSCTDHSVTVIGYAL